ncbi:MAG: radical SAM protein, partial [Sphingomonas sp.]
QPIESDWRITRSVLEVLSETRHPFTITTKSDRVTRDIDLIAPMAAQGLAGVALSITSLDPRTAATVEPRAPHPERRLLAVRRLADAGVPVYVSIAPVIPAVTDHEMEHLVARAAAAGFGAAPLFVGPGRAVGGVEVGGGDGGAGVDMGAQPAIGAGERADRGEVVLTRHPRRPEARGEEQAGAARCRRLFDQIEKLFEVRRGE